MGLEPVHQLPFGRSAERGMVNHSFASLIYAGIIFSSTNILQGWLPYFLQIFVRLLSFPLLILYLNKFRLNRHFFLAFLNPNAFSFIYFLLLVRQVFPSGILKIVYWLMTLSGLFLWFVLAFLFDLPELKLKRGLIWAAFYVLCIAAGELLQALSLPSSLSTFGWFSISFCMGIGLAIGYLLYPFAYQTRKQASTQTVR